MRISTVPQEKRIYHILKALKEDRAVRVSSLAQNLGVPESVIRDDLNWLGNIVPIGRHHGGARLDAIFSPYKGTDYDSRRKEHSEQKQLIASFTVEYFIRAGDRLFLTPGSTPEALVAAFAHERKSLSVVTNAANFALYFSDTRSSSYVQLGGLLATTTMGFQDDDRGSSENFFSERAREFVKSNCEGMGYKAVISGVGFDNRHGLTIREKDLIEYHRVFIDAADTTLVLLDHAKFGYVGDVPLCQCGLRDEDDGPNGSPWLRGPKDMILILDKDWENDEQKREFEKCRSMAKWTPLPIPKKDKMYKTIEAYRGKLLVSSRTKRTKTAE